jgi:hypothetical protein
MSVTEAASQPTPTDPVWNEPAPVKIAGREFRFRELPFLVLRRHLEGLMGLLLDAERKRPGLLETKEIAAEGVLSVLLEEAMLGKSLDAVEALARESTGTNSLAELPASAWLEVVSRAFEAQLPLVRSFFESGARFKAALGVFAPARKDGATPSSSPSSPAAASAGPTQGG